MPGVGLFAAGSALFFWARMGKRAPVVPMPNARTAVGTDTARLLDNFEQRFAELKGRKPNATVLQDLYTLGNQLEQRGRVPQATAVYRHLATLRQHLPRRRRAPAPPHGRRPRQAQGRPNPQPPISQAAMGATTPICARPRKIAPPRPPLPRAVPEVERLGRYQLEREIGRGAMGIVYLGRDTAINRMVAIKAIPLAAEFSDAELVEARSRFFREAETAGRLNHPNIVTIYDVGEERGLGLYRHGIFEGPPFERLCEIQ